MHPCQGARSGLHTSALHTVLHTVHEAEHRAGCNAHSPGCRAHTTSCKGQSALHRAQLGLVHRSRQALPFSHPAGAACTVVHQTSPHHRILPLRPTMPHLANPWTPLPLESINNQCMSYMGQYKAINEMLTRAYKTTNLNQSRILLS